MLGATATGAGDFFPTPFDSLMPGVEIISTAITHLVAGDGIVRDRPVRIVDTVMAIGLPLLLVGLLVWRRNAVGLLAVTAVVLIVGGGQCGRFRARDMARCRDDDRDYRTARHPVRLPAAMVRPATRTASRRAERVA